MGALAVGAQRQGLAEDQGLEVVAGLVRREGGQSVTADLKAVSRNFFEQYGIKPLAGRLFDSKVDREDDIVPLVINAVTAARPANEATATSVEPRK